MSIVIYIIIYSFIRIAITRYIPIVTKTINK